MTLYWRIVSQEAQFNLPNHTTGEVAIGSPRVGVNDNRDDVVARWVLDGLTAVLQLCACLSMIALPSVAHAVHPAFGILAVVLVMGVCASFWPHLVVSTVLAGFMFQNLFVSLLADAIATKGGFDVMRAYNFLALAVSWAVIAGQSMARWGSLPERLRTVLWRSGAVLALIGLYFCMGFMLFGSLAIVNLRNIVIPTLFFQICIVTFARAPVRIGPLLTALAMLYLCCGLVEAFSRDTWLAWSNSPAYWDLAKGQNWETLDYDKLARETGNVVTGLKDTFKIDIFNSPLLADLGLVVMRLFGPNMHAISFAYCLSFFAIFTLYRGRFLQALAFFALLMLASAKGPVIVFLGAGFGWLMWQLVGMRLALAIYAILLAAYAVIGFLTGQRIGDFHVLGLVAGLQEFIANPLGHGIGAGGNLSPQFSTINWQHAQAAGRTPFPVESSVGVLMYQMGLCGLVVIAFYVSVAIGLLRLAETTRNNLQAATAFALLTIITNALFQEEAMFAPLAMSPFLALSGMMLGAGIRSGVTVGRSGA